MHRPYIIHLLLEAGVNINARNKVILLLYSVLKNMYLHSMHSFTAWSHCFARDRPPIRTLSRPWPHGCRNWPKCQRQLGVHSSGSSTGSGKVAWFVCEIRAWFESCNPEQRHGEDWVFIGLLVCLSLGSGKSAQCLRKFIFCGLKRHVVGFF